MSDNNSNDDDYNSNDDNTSHDAPIETNDLNFIHLMIQSAGLNSDGVDREFRIAEMFDDVLERKQIDILIAKFRTLLNADGKLLGEMSKTRLTVIRSHYESAVGIQPGAPFIATEHWNEYANKDEEYDKLNYAIEKLNMIQEEFNKLLVEYMSKPRPRVFFRT